MSFATSVDSTADVPGATDVGTVDSPANALRASGGRLSPLVGQLRILSVEDNPDDVELVRLALLDAGLDAQLHHVTEEGPFIAALEQRSFDVVLCDYQMPRFSPQRALAILQARRPDLPLVVVTRSIGEAAAVEILRMGARDYVSKDRLATLKPIVDRVMGEQAMQRVSNERHRHLLVAHERLKVMAARLVSVQEQERKSLSRELHDAVGQSLTSVLLHLEAAERLGSTQKASDFRNVAMSTVRQVIGQVRTLSFTLRPPQIEMMGLEGAVQSAATLLLRPRGIELVITSRGSIARASATQLSVLYRVALEAVTNVARHSSASVVEIRFTARADGRIAATVYDNGSGFQAGRFSRERAREGHQGIAGMFERCELVGGRLTIRSRVGRGTAIHAFV